MRTIRLGREFDRVLIHDAICYTMYTVDYVYMLRSADGSVSIEHDRHIDLSHPRNEHAVLRRDEDLECANALRGGAHRSLIVERADRGWRRLVFHTRA